MTLCTAPISVAQPDLRAGARRVRATEIPRWLSGERLELSPVERLGLFDQSMALVRCLAMAEAQSLGFGRANVAASTTWFRWRRKRRVVVGE